MLKTSLARWSCTSIVIFLIAGNSITQAQAPPSVLNFKEYITTVQFSPDGKWLAVVSESNITILGASKLKPAGVIPVKTLNGLHGFTFSADGKKVAAGTADYRVLVWNIAMGRVERAFKGHIELVTCVAFSPDGKLLATGSSDKSLRLWDLVKGTEVVKIPLADSKGVSGVCYHPEGKKLISCGKDGVKQWEVPTGKQLPPLADALTKSGWDAVAFSSDGSKLVARSHELAVLNLTTGKVTKTNLNASVRMGLAFSPDATMIAVGTDSEVTIFGSETGERMHRFEGHQSGVQSVTFSRDSKRLASGSADKTVRIWHLAPTK